MHELTIPELTPLLTYEVWEDADPQAGQLVPPVPSDILFFRVPGVKDEHVAQVLQALVERRLVERARKAVKNRKSIARPSLGSVIVIGIAGFVTGGLAGLGFSSAELGAASGAFIGIVYGLCQRAKILTAFNGLKLLYGEPAGAADERLHPNYWMPFAIRELCSPDPGILPEA